MELRLLSTGDALTLGPDPAAEVRRVLEKLPEHSGEKLPRAVLIHDNGQDFIQFYATEVADPEKPAGKVPCQIQWCRQSGSRSKPEHLFCDQVDYERVIELFELYAQKKEDWGTGVSWEPYKEKREGRTTFSGLSSGCTCLLIGLILLAGVIPEIAPIMALVPLGVGVFFWWSVFFPRTSYGKPWDASSDGGGSCSRGCGSGCGGDGGGGGDGGCGGCGGGGE